MKGTENQVAWATEIENNILDCCKKGAEDFSNRAAEYDNDAHLAKCAELYALVGEFYKRGFARMDDAAVIIDKRNQFPNPCHMVDGYVMRSANTGIDAADIAKKELHLD